MFKIFKTLNIKMYLVSSKIKSRHTIISNEYYFRLLCFSLLF